MRIDDMRIALGLGADATDAEIVSLYGAWERDESERLAAAAAISTDPFAVALDAIFYAPGSAPAVYDDGDSDLRAIRVILSQPDRTDGFGRGQYVQRSHVISIRISDVPKPKDGDTVIVDASLVDGVVEGGTEYRLFGEPMGDVEGLSHDCPVEPV